MQNKTYGRELINAMSKAYWISEKFDFNFIEDAHKDRFTKVFLEICTQSYLCEALCGHSEFGPLVEPYISGSANYIKALDLAIKEKSALFSGAEIAELMQCEALDNRDCERLTGMNLLQLFLTNPSAFYDLVCDSCNNYLSRVIAEQIAEALPAYLEERRQVMHNFYNGENAA